MVSVAEEEAVALVVAVEDTLEEILEQQKRMVKEERRMFG